MRWTATMHEADGYGLIGMDGVPMAAGRAKPSSSSPSMFASATLCASPSRRPEPRRPRPSQRLVRVDGGANGRIARQAFDGAIRIEGYGVAVVTKAAETGEE